MIISEKLFYWKTNKEWYDLLEDEEGNPIYVLTDKATPEARESFEYHEYYRKKSEETGILY